MTRQQIRQWGLTNVILLLLLSACERGPEQPKQPIAEAEDQTESIGGAVPSRQSDPAAIARGSELYQAHCAICHGEQAQGDANWRQRTPAGKFPPPPLNGTGHTWHHPTKILRYVIKNGSPGGQGDMPAWKDKLNDREIDDIIAWFQSLWPDQAYEAWLEIEQRSLQSSR